MSEVRQPLYGHTSPETAYLVDDYPYGRTLRCKIRYWLEYKPRKGFRLCSQTTNPKAGHAWNKPKCSTYTEHAACMYLDELGHVSWRGVGIYSEPEKVLEFVRLFPRADMSVLGPWCAQKAAFHDRYAAGEVRLVMNGAPIALSEYEQQRERAYAAHLREAARLIADAPT